MSSDVLKLPPKDSEGLDEFFSLLWSQPHNKYGRSCIGHLSLSLTYCSQNAIHSYRRGIDMKGKEPLPIVDKSSQLRIPVSAPLQYPLMTMHPGTLRAHMPTLPLHRLELSLLPKLQGHGHGGSLFSLLPVNSSGSKSFLELQPNVSSQHKTSQGIPIVVQR